MDDENKKQDLSNISIEEEEMTNPYLRGHRLTTVVNKAYDCPDAYNPAKFSGKCIKTLLLPRILDVFIIITAGVFMLRISFIKSKRKKTKNDDHIPKEAFPKAYIEKGRLVFSTVFFGALLFGAYFVISLILKKKWSDMPVKVDLAICAGVLILLNIPSCIKVGHSVIRCYTCHVIGDVHTYKDIKHNRNRISCVCPYCLQVYEQRNVVVNDTYEGKSYTVTDTIHDQQHKSPTKYI